MEQNDIQAIVRQAIEEYTRSEQIKSEPAYKTELIEEKRRREQLERKLNEFAEENKRTRQMAEEAERGAAIRAELHRLGVGKIDLAYKAVQNDIYRSPDGRFLARTESGDIGLKEYLASFVGDNPEFLPARISGGSGVLGPQKVTGVGSESVDVERIRPGMSPEEMDRVRQEVVRVASQTLKGL